MKIAPYAKAVLAAGIAGGTALVSSLDGGVSGQEWVVIVVAALVGLGGVYAVPNAAIEPRKKAK